MTALSLLRRCVRVPPPPRFGLLASVTVAAIIGLLPGSANAAVGINTYFNSRPIEAPDGSRLATLEGIVTAVASLPTNCPAARGDGSDPPTPGTDDTYCTYNYTAIERNVSGIWGQIILCAGCGPTPGTNRIELLGTCIVSGSYRTFFQQLVKGGRDTAWTDARFTGGDEVDCDLNVTRIPPP